MGFVKHRQIADKLTKIRILINDYQMIWENVVILKLEILFLFRLDILTKHGMYAETVKDKIFLP